MIIDHVSQVSQYYTWIAGLDKAFAWLNGRQADEIGPGTYAIDGQRVYAIVTVIDPHNQPDTHFETHRRYIDCHVVVSGTETVAYAPVSALQPAGEYDPAGDCRLFTGIGRLLTLDPGQFWLALPTDAHWPAIRTAASQPVRKVIFKLAAD